MSELVKPRNAIVIPRLTLIQEQLTRLGDRYIETKTDPVVGGLLRQAAYLVAQARDRLAYKRR